MGKLLDAGIRATLNTDNMMVSGVTLESEMEKLAEVFPLTEEHFKTLARNAANASFASTEDKAWMLQKIEEM